MRKQANISVVMSVFNGSNYVDSAIRSILDQTFESFEFIIINDGSTDDTLKKINKYNDDRIIVVDQKNKGLVESLNKGISISSSNFIARQDADDISLPSRLDTQFNFLKTNTDVALVGSSIITINEEGHAINKHKVLLQDNELKQELMIRSPFAHGSVMFRKNLFEEAGGYIGEEWPAEDYGLWLRMSDYGKFANIDEPLYKYMENGTGISSNNLQQQNDKKNEIAQKAWSKKARLLNYPYNVKIYKQYGMGEYRIERIVENLSFTIRKSVKNAEFIYALKSLLIILSNKILLRKYIRLTLIKLKLKHA